MRINQPTQEDVDFAADDSATYDLYHRKYHRDNREKENARVRSRLGVTGFCDWCGKYEYGSPHAQCLYAKSNSIIPRRK